MTLTDFALVVHATHEAGVKVGGIGAVLDGLLSQPAYNRAVRRTLVAGPFNPWDRLEMERLYAPRNGFKARYSAHDGFYDVPPDVARALTQVELGYRVRLLYGTRRFGDAEHEILLVDPRGADPAAANGLKYHLWERYGIDSTRYEWLDEYNLYLNAAEPTAAGLAALVDGAEPDSGQAQRAAIIAHEWLGLPLAFSAARHQPGVYRTVFYAHETASVRPLVEFHPGHDTRFYNVMVAARQQGRFLEDVFGSQRGFFKHALVSAAAQCDGVFAVGDLVVDELRFLSPAFAARPIALVYNGAPAQAVSLTERFASKQRLQRYAENLYGFRLSWVFTHVTRLVQSKALWRDVRVMEELDGLLAARGETAILYLLSSSIPSGRRAEDVMRWEAQYGWPVAHRADNGDLAGLEVETFQALARYNDSAQASRIVLVNQFGWSRDRCGLRMPAEMSFADIRNGSDLEFGQSIYEPFGIGQIEPLSAGALCCLSNVCGCVGFISKAGGLALPNIVLADYVTLPPRYQSRSLSELLGLGQWQRDVLEAITARATAQKIVSRLPRDEHAARSLLEQGDELGQRLSWPVVVEDMFLPGLERLFRG
ncbi:MAG: hypothetical protein HY259_02190 [Chloroflexi bacterium]|nr:hypothetical protein [Chloroflexota bacterium]